MGKRSFFLALTTRMRWPLFNPRHVTAHGEECRWCYSQMAATSASGRLRRTPAFQLKVPQLWATQQLPATSPPPPLPPPLSRTLLPQPSPSRAQPPPLTKLSPPSSHHFSKPLQLVWSPQQ